MCWKPRATQSNQSGFAHCLKKRFPRIRFWRLYLRRDLHLSIGIDDKCIHILTPREHHLGNCTHLAGDTGVNRCTDKSRTVGDFLAHQNLIPHLHQGRTGSSHMLLHGNDHLRGRRHDSRFHLCRILSMRHMCSAMCFEWLFRKCKFHSFPSIFKHTFFLSIPFNGTPFIE